MKTNELSELILDGAEAPKTILVQCNDVRYIIGAALTASKQLKKYDVYYQPNSDFYWGLEIGEITTAKYYEQQFKDYCNYFDKHRVALITRINKKLINYSKNNEVTNFTDYPSDIKMILIVENFNFWDLNSQSFIAQLSGKQPNIIVIGQLRDDFDFVKNHIDIGVRSGKGGATFVELEI